jgi:hypothetical protein
MSEGEGVIDKSINEHSIGDVEHDHGGEEGEVGGRWHQDDDDFVNVDFAAASSDDDVSLPELVSQRQCRRALRASTEHAGTPVSNSFFRIIFANTNRYCVVGAAATGRVTWRR